MGPDPNNPNYRASFFGEGGAMPKQGMDTGGIYMPQSEERVLEEYRKCPGESI